MVIAGNFYATNSINLNPTGTTNTTRIDSTGITTNKLLATNINPNTQGGTINLCRDVANETINIGNNSNINISGIIQAKNSTNTVNNIFLDTANQKLDFNQVDINFNGTLKDVTFNIPPTFQDVDVTSNGTTNNFTVNSKLKVNNTADIIGTTSVTGDTTIIGKFTVNENTNLISKDVNINSGLGTIKLNGAYIDIGVNSYLNYVRIGNPFGFSIVSIYSANNIPVNNFFNQMG